MSETTAQWLKISANDYEAAVSLMNLNNPSFYASICFHCQQSVEKLLKALLIQHNKDFEKTHDLMKLKLLLQSLEIEIKTPERELEFLSICAVEFRYPGEEATLEDAQDALDISKRLRIELLPKLKTS